MARAWKIARGHTGLRCFKQAELLLVHPRILQSAVMLVESIENRAAVEAVALQLISELTA